MSDENPERDESTGGSDADTGSGVHTPVEEGHPDLEGERSARDLGGPTAADDAEAHEGTEGGGKGNRPTEGFDAHE